MEHKSNAGDWLFLIGAIVMLCGYFAYENMDAVNAWLLAMQTPPATQSAVVMATDAGMGEWLAQHWGMAMLAFALTVVGVKSLLAQRGQPATDGGTVVTYKRFKFLSVKLVR